IPRWRIEMPQSETSKYTGTSFLAIPSHPVPKSHIVHAKELLYNTVEQAPRPNAVAMTKESIVDNRIQVTLPSRHNLHADRLGLRNDTLTQALEAQARQPRL